MVYILSYFWILKLELRIKNIAYIEKTFEDLFKLEESLDQETKHKIREYLDEESLVIFDLLINLNYQKNILAESKKFLVIF